MPLFKSHIQNMALDSSFSWSAPKGKVVLDTITTLGVVSPNEMRLGFAQGFIGFNTFQACGNPTMKSVVLNK